MGSRHRFTNDVKSCPKESRYKLTYCDLQRFLWRLWKRKDENPCYARARKPQNKGFLFFTHFIQCIAITSTISPHHASEEKVPTTRKLRWRFPQKRWTFFQKTPTFFCFSPTFFQLSRRKNDAPRFLRTKSKDDNHTPIIKAQNIQSARKHTFLGDYLKFYLCMPIKIYNFAK